MRAILKFKATRTLFLTDVFVAYLRPGFALKEKGEKNQGGQKNNQRAKQAARGIKARFAR